MVLRVRSGRSAATARGDEKLIAFRKQIFPTPAVNVFWQTREEMRTRGLLPWERTESPADEN